VGLLAAVAAFDREPVVRLLALAGPLGHPHERPAAGEASALELEVELALREPLGRVAERRPVTAIPDHDAAGAVLVLGDLALEVGVLERVVLGLHREPAILRVEARLFRHRPALQHAVVLEPEVVMEPARIVLLHDVLQPRTGAARGFAARLRRHREVALALIALEVLGHGRKLQQPVQARPRGRSRASAAAAPLSGRQGCSRRSTAPTTFDSRRTAERLRWLPHPPSALRPERRTG